MARLTFVGERPKRGSAIPLPEGWTMDEHDEDNELLAVAKLASGLYALAPGTSAGDAGEASDDVEEPEEAESPD